MNDIVWTIKSVLATERHEGKRERSKNNMIKVFIGLQIPGLEVLE